MTVRGPRGAPPPLHELAIGAARNRYVRDEVDVEEMERQIGLALVGDFSAWPPPMAGMATAPELR